MRAHMIMHLVPFREWLVFAYTIHPLAIIARFAATHMNLTDMLDQFFQPGNPELAISPSTHVDVSLTSIEHISRNFFLNFRCCTFFNRTFQRFVFQLYRSFDQLVRVILSKKVQVGLGVMIGSGHNGQVSLVKGEHGNTFCSYQDHAS